MFVADRRTGLLFTNRIGNPPLSQTNELRRSLHPILENEVSCRRIRLDTGLTA